MEHFRPFSAVHLAAAAVSIGSMAVLVSVGRLLKRSGREYVFRRAWAVSILVFQTIVAVWWVLPANFEAQRSIPLNMCRLVAFIAGVALLAQDRARCSRALLYFWGLGLCTQAIITPVFPEGPAHALFWIFWIGHTQIVGSSLYDLIVLRYRPSTRDFVFTCGANLVYLAAVVPLNAAYRLNYGGLGPVLFDAPNLARRLGPWPWRPVWITAIAWGWMALLWVAWRVPGRSRRAENLAQAARAHPAAAK